MVCIIIEVVVDTLTVAIYAVIFYRFYSKNKLRKSMYARDKARSDLYLAHLRSQTAPNTPGYPLSPGSAHFAQTPGAARHDPYSAAEKGEPQYATQFASPTPPTVNRPFQLQPPPIRVQGPTRDNSPTDGQPSIPTDLIQTVNNNGHVGPAPGEQQYASVPIPGSYATPLASPAFMSGANGQRSQGSEEGGNQAPGMAMTTDNVVHSRNQSS